MSIRLRLTIYWAAILAGILIVATVAAFQLFEREQRASLDAALLEEADTTAEDIKGESGDRAVTRLFELSEERDLGEFRRVQMITPAGVFADFGYPDAKPPAIPANTHFRGIVDGADGRFRYAVKPFTFNRQPAVILDGVDGSPLNAAIRQLRTILLLTVPFVLLLCVAGGYWLAGGAVAPIESIASALSAIQPSDLSRRLDAPRIRDEVGRLVAVINALLDRLERASATERRFASDAAHELRTPLAVLRSGLEVSLARERSAEDNRAALENAHREVVALCKVAEELLMLARLNGEVAIDRKPLELDALVDDVASAVELLASAKDVALECSTAAGTVVEGNETNLKRVVINLLDNALKFTPEGGRIEVILTRGDGRATLRIADSGPGIEPSELPHIFERFFRGRRAIGEGAGLGLNLCQEIVRLHGGDIHAVNRSTGGCEFVVSIPLATSDSIRAAAGA